MKHTMVKMLCSGKLYYAPIAENPQMILDIGTGTGIWAIESEQPPAPRHVHVHGSARLTDPCHSGRLV